MRNPCTPSSQTFKHHLRLISKRRTDTQTSGDETWRATRNAINDGLRRDRQQRSVYKDTTAIVRSNLGLTQKRQKEDEEDSSPGSRERERERPGYTWSRMERRVSGGPLSTDPSYRGVRHEHLLLSTNTTLARK